MMKLSVKYAVMGFVLLIKLCGQMEATNRVVQLAKKTQESLQAQQKSVTISQDNFQAGAALAAKKLNDAGGYKKGLREGLKTTMATSEDQATVEQVVVADTLLRSYKGALKNTGSVAGTWLKKTFRVGDQEEAKYNYEKAVAASKWIGKDRKAKAQQTVISTIAKAAAVGAPSATSFVAPAVKRAQEKAATKMQAAFRGKLGRKKATAAKIAQADARKTAEAERAAATKIQATFRGRLGHWKGDQEAIATARKAKAERSLETAGTEMRKIDTILRSRKIDASATVDDLNESLRLATEKKRLVLEMGASAIITGRIINIAGTSGLSRYTGIKYADGTQFRYSLQLSMNNQLIAKIRDELARRKGVVFSEANPSEEQKLIKNLGMLTNTSTKLAKLDTKLDTLEKERTAIFKRGYSIDPNDSKGFFQMEFDLFNNTEKRLRTTLKQVDAKATLNKQAEELERDDLAVPVDGTKKATMQNQLKYARRMVQDCLDTIFKDELAVFGLTPGATATELTSAYRRLAFNLHPDKANKAIPGNLSPEERTALVLQNTARFQKMQNTYDDLKIYRDAYEALNPSATVPVRDRGTSVVAIVPPENKTGMQLRLTAQ